MLDKNETLVYTEYEKESKESQQKVYQLEAELLQAREKIKNFEEEISSKVSKKAKESIFTIISKDAKVKALETQLKNRDEIIHNLENDMYGLSAKRDHYAEQLKTLTTKEEQDTELQKTIIDVKNKKAELQLILKKLSMATEKYNLLKVNVDRDNEDYTTLVTKYNSKLSEYMLIRTDMVKLRKEHRFITWSYLGKKQKPKLLDKLKKMFMEEKENK